MARKSDPIIRHATQAAQKLEQMGDPRAANDVRKACQHNRYLLGLIDNLRGQLNATTSRKENA